jgi:DNA-binding NarL/FixJ family response regulator
VKKSVFVIDDHTAIREGFRAILERSGTYTVTGESSSAEDVLARLDGGEAFPDLFIIDISLPGMGGIELVSALRSRSMSPIVILSMHRRYDYMVRAFRAGAAGYVAKDAGVECITSALSAAAAGGAYLDPASLRLFVDEVTSGRRTAAPVEESAARPEPSHGLSEREDEVLGLLASGKRAEEIAATLGLSQKTVENHLSNITTKLGAHNRFELYRLAARMGRE